MEWSKFPWSESLAAREAYCPWISSVHANMVPNTSTPFFLAGTSAGANLAAAVTLYDIHQLGHRRRVTGLLLYTPVLDLTNDALDSESWRTFKYGPVVSERGMMHLRGADSLPLATPSRLTSLVQIYIIQQSPSTHGRTLGFLHYTPWSTLSNAILRHSFSPPPTMPCAIKV